MIYKGRFSSLNGTQYQVDIITRGTDSDTGDTPTTGTTTTGDTPTTGETPTSGGTVYVTFIDGTTREITYDDGIAGYLIQRVGYLDGKDEKDIASVVFGEGITEIDWYCCSACTNLTAVTFPDTLVTIGGCAFKFCNIKGIQLPKSLRNIGYQAFFGAGVFKRLYIPDSVQYVGSFESCGIEEVIIGSGVTKIAGGRYNWGAFDWNTQLKTIAIRASTPPKTDVYGPFNENQIRDNNGTFYYPKGSDYSDWISYHLPSSWETVEVAPDEWDTLFPEIDDSEDTGNTPSDTPSEPEEIDDSNLLMSGEPVIINYKSDETFSPIKGRGCTISIMSESYHFDMYDPYAQGTAVIVKNLTTDTVMFQGYLTPAVYSQTYSIGHDSIELEAIDSLSTLKYFQYKTLDEGKYNIVTFRNVLDRILLKGGYSKYYWPKNMYAAGSTQCPLDQLGIDEKNFFDDDKDHTPWTLEEVLEEICRFFCVSCVPYENKLYFVSYPSVTGGINQWTDQDGSTVTLSKTYAINKDSYRDEGAQIDLTEVYRKISISCNEYIEEEVNLDVYDEENRVHYTETLVKYSSEQDAQSKQGSVCYTKYYKQNGNCYDTYWYKPNHDFDDPWGGNQIIGFDPLHLIDQNPCPFSLDLFPTEGSTYFRMNSSMDAMVGCLPLRIAEVGFDYKQDDFGDEPKFDNQFIFSLGGIEKGGENYKFSNKLVLHIKTGRRIFKPAPGYTTYIIIDGSLCYNHILAQFSKTDFFPYKMSFVKEKKITSVKDNEQYAHYAMFQYMVHVGNSSYCATKNLYGEAEDYHAQGSWKSNIGGPFYPTIMYSKASESLVMNKFIDFDCNADFRLGLGGKGYVIPITSDDDVSGELSIDIYCPYIPVAGWYFNTSWGHRHFNYDYDRYPPFAQMKDFKISVKTVDNDWNPINEDDEQDDDILYETDIDELNVPEFDTTELKINTQRPDRQPTLSAVMDGTEKYLEEITDTSDSRTRTALQEEHILNHYYDHYHEPRVQLGLTIDQPLPPYTKVTYPTQFPDREFIVEKQSINLRNDKTEINITEF